jgi:hypothetical protein
LEVKGTLTPIHGGATITIRYLKDGKEEAKKTVVTNDDGQFLDSINPGSGSWTVTVSWIGDYNHDESTSESKAFNVVKAKWQIPGYKESSIIMGFVIAILVAQLKKGQKSTSTGH